jgi:hypothetical protein
MAIISTRVYVLPLDEIETARQSAAVRKQSRYSKVEFVTQDEIDPIELATWLNLLQT